jgi:S-(hydroxymethyl)glutathione dehydrogenase / alcohol dehydrogenase
MKALVLRSIGSPQVEEIKKPSPSKSEVLVRLMATGVCHTDVSVMLGRLPLHLPLVMGHEGAGIVEAIGSDVSTLAVGDHVVCSIVVSCGKCYHCLKGEYSLCGPGVRAALGGAMLSGGKRLFSGDAELGHFMCQSSFAEYATVPEESAVAIDRAAPFEIAALLGCGAMTGIGAVTRRSRVAFGDTVVVIGAGGVGLSVIMAARAAGAAKIVAIDLSPDALQLAEAVGATHTIASREDNVHSKVAAILPHGADHTFDVVGTPSTLSLAVSLARANGAVTLIGLQDPSAPTAEVSMLDLISSQKRLTGTYGGSITPQLDIPIAVDLFLDGRLPLDKLISNRIGLDGVPSALDALEAGQVGRSVVVFG